MRRKQYYRPYEGRKKPLWLLAVLAGALAFALGFVVLLGIVLTGAHDQIVGEPKVMVILGCKAESWGPSILLQDRLDKALDYLEDHPDLTVVVSGGQGDDEHQSEAQCMYDYLTDHGVDADQILLEDQSHNTWENIRFTQGDYTLSTLAAPSSRLPSRLRMYIREPFALVKSFFFDR